MLELNRIYCGDTRDLLKDLRDDSIHCCVTSPPYWGLRDYGCDGQLGLEKTPEEFIQSMVEIFREVKRALRKDGTLWLNLGDSYGTGTRADKRPGNKGLGKKTAEAQGIPRHGGMAKQLIGIPWRVALAMQADGWLLRQDIIWAKPNPLPESVTDRCTKSHEYIFLMSKSERYFYDHESIKEPAIGGQCPSALSFEREVNEPIRPGQIYPQHRKKRPSKKKGSFNGKTEAMAGTGQNAFRAVTNFRNKRSVWTVATKPFKKAHFATFPTKLIEPCILAGCPKGGTVLDPFSGAGTTAFVAAKNNRNFIGFELNSDYVEIAERRIMNAEPQLF